MSNRALGRGWGSPWSRHHATTLSQPHLWLAPLLALLPSPSVDLTLQGCPLLCSKPSTVAQAHTSPILPPDLPFAFALPLQLPFLLLCPAWARAVCSGRWEIRLSSLPSPPRRRPISALSPHGHLQALLPLRQGALRVEQIHLPAENKPGSRRRFPPRAWPGLGCTKDSLPPRELSEEQLRVAPAAL